MNVPVDQKEGPHFGNDELASPSLMSEYVKDLSEVSASSCELGQLLPDKEISDKDIRTVWMTGLSLSLQKTK